MRLTVGQTPAQYVQRKTIMEPMSMYSLYDSDAYLVVHIPFPAIDGRPARDSFEILDKTTNKGVFLIGKWADAFQAQIDKWQAKTPEQEAVERTLEQYTVLAQNPLVYH